MIPVLTVLILKPSSFLIGQEKFSRGGRGWLENEFQKKFVSLDFGLKIKPAISSLESGGRE